MLAADPIFFADDNTNMRNFYHGVLQALLATVIPHPPDATPTVLRAEGEGEEARGPPQRDEEGESKFKLGVSLQEEDQLRALAMLENNSDRFAISI